MCGRYTLRRPGLIAKLVHQLDFDEFHEIKLVPRWNVAPATLVPLIRPAKDGGLKVALARWGLIPAWTRGKPKAQPINARSETVATGGMFRQAFARRRCLMPADGFYEWRGEKPPKTPYFFRRPDDEPFVFAALWDRWRPDEDAEPVDTCCLLTTRPSADMRPVHDRMPVILPPAARARWLDPEASAEDLLDLLVPLPDDSLEKHAVSTAVNAAKHDGPELVEPDE